MQASPPHLAPSVNDEQQSFMAELGRLQAAAQSRTRELAQAKVAEDALAGRLATLRVEGQKARRATLQLELDTAAAVVDAAEARRAAQQDRAVLCRLTKLLYTTQSRQSALCAPAAPSIPLEDDVASPARVEAAARQLTDPVRRTLECVQRQPRLAQALLQPLRDTLVKLAAMYAEQQPAAAHAEAAAAAVTLPPLLPASSQFYAWLRERAGATLTDADVAVLVYVGTAGPPP